MEFKDVNQLPIDVEEAIKKRVSTRSFEEKALTDEDKNNLMDFNRTLTNPFGIDVHVQHIRKNTGEKNIQLGTYGTIKGARDFLAITVKDEPFAMEAVGYQFENLILYATHMNLGTVWLAATFSRKDFEKVMDISSDDLFPCICPIGYPSEKRSIIEKFTRASLGSKNRKPWETLFYLEGFNNPMSKNDAGDYELALEMLRLAPSATNAQPWAVVKEGNKFHFFCNYKNSINDDMKKIKHLDLGISLSHFHQTAMSNGLRGRFEMQEIHFQVSEHMHYVISYIMEKENDIIFVDSEDSALKKLNMNSK
ncbi:nitroreductase family protein [Peptostreptococcus porci]|uniref:nitroreductase family protein n=1 Tax=Peptostreptococcus porci TaxID=2652282 RepID=UPI0023F27469|nr:nitroreductase family protein [Peptostreptococcus porci]MDD7183359.1 nitroreductase family protein [Peptostreptococcus porci]